MPARWRRDTCFTPNSVRFTPRAWEQRAHERLLAVEVLVQARGAVPGSRADLAQRQRVGALLQHQLARAAAQAGRDDEAFAPRASAEELAYSLWAMVHGMATLQLVHLEGFHADFETIDRVALETYVAGLAAG
jgi:hypothetical protein